MRLLLGALFLSAWSTFASAQGVRVEIRDPGIYSAVERGRERVPSLATGDITYIENARLEERTTTVNARLGVRFGYTYDLMGRQAGDELSLRFVTRFPQPGLRNPSTGNTTVTEEITQAKTAGESHVDLYSFEHEWELVPGVWTFEIWYEGLKLAEQKFNIVTP